MIKKSGDVMMPWVLSAQEIEYNPSMAILTANEPHFVGEAQPQQY